MTVKILGVFLNPDLKVDLRTTAIYAQRACSELLLGKIVMVPS